jgi:protein-tyrosine-phosphatase
MAQAIAWHLLMNRSREGGGTDRIRIESAGVAAAPGMPMTREAQEALRAMQIDPGHHRSQPLTRDLIESADTILTMTSSHRDRVRQLAPGAAAKVHTLDPQSRDIPDPIGGSLDDYRGCATKLLELVSQRLRELTPQ